MKKLIRIIMIILTLVYPLFMTCLTGIGLIYNKSSYGAETALIGFFLIFSGISMTSGAFLSLAQKKSKNIAALACSICGLAVCLVSLYLLCRHADSAGWCDNYTLLPVSDMYRRRILPVIIPSAISTATAIFNIKQNWTS